jgi:organic radical activating enzyme
MKRILLHEIFSSVQGEGFMSGTPMTFIRLWGCNLSCPWCDTPQTTNDEHETTIEALAAAVYALGNRWVCITGGEPTIHPELGSLVSILQQAGMKVAIETNGTKALWAVPDWLCVSPKTDWMYSMLEIADEIKVLVGSGMYDAGDFIEAHREFIPKMCLQPIWRNAIGTAACIRRAIELCHKYQIRLSVQLHKYIGVR